MLVWLLWELYSGLPPQYLPDNHANHSVASYIIHVALFDEFLQWFFLLIVVFENGDSERGRRSLPTRRSMVRFLHGQIFLQTLLTSDKNNTVRPRFTDTHLIRTPHYYGQLTVSLGKENPQHFLKIQPAIDSEPIRALGIIVLVKSY